MITEDVVGGSVTFAGFAAHCVAERVNSPVLTAAGVPFAALSDGCAVFFVIRAGENEFTFQARALP